MDLGGLLTGAGQIAAAYAPYEMSEGESQKLLELGQQARTGATQVGQTASEAAAFQPFSVRFGTSTTQIGPEGVTSELDPTLANIQGGLLGQTEQLMGQAPVTAESLYNQILGIQAPEQQRQQLELENRLASQGRLGLQTAAYGGAPEQFALAQAQEEARNRAALSALQAAPGLQQQQIQNISGLLGAAFVPQQQSIAAMQPALDAARIQQAARQGQTEALYRSGIAGLEAEATAGTAAANIEAARTQALANALSGMFARPVSNTGIQGTSSADDFLRALGL